MNTLVKAAGAGFLVFLVPSYLFYEMLMKEQFAVWEAEVARAEPLMAFGLLGILILMFVMAVMYPKGYQGGDPLQEGARFGFTMGVFLSGMVLIFYSVYELQLMGSLTDIVFNVLLLTLVGAVMGKVYGGDAA